MQLYYICKVKNNVLHSAFICWLKFRHVSTLISVMFWDLSLICKDFVSNYVFGTAHVMKIIVVVILCYSS